MPRLTPRNSIRSRLALPFWTVLVLLISGCANVPNDAHGNRPDILTVLVAPTVIALRAAPTVHAMVADLTSDSIVFEAEISGNANAPVQRFDAPFSIGRYQVAGIARRNDDNGGSNLNLGGLFQHEKKPNIEIIHYRFADKHEAWAAHCSYQQTVEAVKLLGGAIQRTSAQLSCECASQDRKVVLKQREDNRSNMTGTIEFGDQRYQLTQFRIWGGVPSLKAPAAGYRVEHQGRPCAAISLVSPGKIWVRRDLPADAQAPMACALTGLVLFARNRSHPTF